MSTYFDRSIPNGLLLMAASAFSILLDVPWHQRLISRTYAMRAWIHACMVPPALSQCLVNRARRIAKPAGPRWLARLIELLATPRQGIYRVLLILLCLSPCLWLGLRALKSMPHMHLMSTGSDPSVFVFFLERFLVRNDGAWISCLRKR
jgi:hypothetical protein